MLLGRRRWRRVGLADGRGFGSRCGVRVRCVRSLSYLMLRFSVIAPRDSFGFAFGVFWGGDYWLAENAAGDERVKTSAEATSWMGHAGTPTLPSISSASEP